MNELAQKLDHGLADIEVFETVLPNAGPPNSTPKPRSSPGDGLNCFLTFGIL
jgi:hypothetical protein